LGKYWPSRKVPVDIEHIADVELGINIVPVPDLLAVAEVDGFLSADRKEVYIDEAVFRHRQLYRYRFTIAHELAHLHLHTDLCATAKFRSVQEWKDFQDSIPEEDRSWFEWQAYSFAGLILVPADPLARFIRQAIAKARAITFNIDLSVDAHRTYLAEWVGRRFEVSGEVILRRGQYDGHWQK
jgi:Zn-dependent peptidase ImmA (M78 family)